VGLCGGQSGEVRGGQGPPVRAGVRGVVDHGAMPRCSGAGLELQRGELLHTLYALLGWWAQHGVHEVKGAPERRQATHLHLLAKVLLAVGREPLTVLGVGGKGAWGVLGMSRGGSVPPAQGVPSCQAPEVLAPGAERGHAEQQSTHAQARTPRTDSLKPTKLRVTPSLTRTPSWQPRVTRVQNRPAMSVGVCVCAHVRVWETGVSVWGRRAGAGLARAPACMHPIMHVHARSRTYPPS